MSRCATLNEHRYGAKPDVYAGTDRDGLRVAIAATDPEESLEYVSVHPDADYSFMQTVMAVVEHFAPSLKNNVPWSSMNARPPF